MTQTTKAVLFDFNGTINDMNVVLEQDIHVGKVEFGLELSPQDVIDSWGVPPEAFYQKLFGRSNSGKTWQEMQQILHSYDDMFPRRLLPGVASTLASLKKANIVTGIVTSSQHSGVLKCMAQGGLDPDVVDFIHADRIVAPAMAACRPVLGQALGERTMRGIASSEIAFVGDEKITITDAEAIGVKPVVVASGTVTKENLLAQGIDRTMIIDTLDQLPAYLNLAV